MQPRGLTVVSRVAVALLFLATFAALFLSQKLKSAPAMVQVLRQPTRFFSPLGRDPRRHVTRFSFRLKRRELVTVEIVTAHGDKVRRLSIDATPHPYRRVYCRWDDPTGVANALPAGADHVR